MRMIEHQVIHEVLTVRDQFAIAALTGLIANSYDHHKCGNFFHGMDEENMAIATYRYADAMLKARETKEENNNEQ